MSKIPTTFLPPLFGTESSNKTKAAGGGGFGDVFNSKLNLGFADDLISKITNSANDNRSGDFMNSIFPFSPSFESTFGVGGPLPNFINVVTARLNLSATQNQALQDIAIRNKDITKTPENVQNIAMELRKAGIGA